MKGIAIRTFVGVILVAIVIVIAIIALSKGNEIANLIANYA